MGESDGTSRKEPLVFKHRPIDVDKIDQLNTAINNTNWAQIITNEHISDSYRSFIDYLNKLIDECIPIKKVVIPYRSVIREPCVTADLLKLSKKLQSLYHKSVGKPRTCQEYIKYIQFRANYNSTKRQTKYNNFEALLSE